MFKNGQKRKEGGLRSSICPLVSLSVNRWRHYKSPLESNPFMKRRGKVRILKDRPHPLAKETIQEIASVQPCELQRPYELMHGIA